MQRGKLREVSLIDKFSWSNCSHQKVIVMRHEGGQTEVGAWRLVGNVNQIVEDLEENRKSKTATGILLGGRHS
jgi:hypothetical protein